MSAKVIPIAKESKVPVYQKIESGLYLNTKNGIYYVRKSFKHLRLPDLFESLRTDKITVARREMVRKIEHHKERYLGGRIVTERDDRNGKPIASIIDEMLITYTPKKRLRTQENHKFFFGELKEHWGIMDVNRFSLVMWEKWFQEFKIQKSKVNPKTRRSRHTFDDYVVKMNIILNYAHQHKYLHHSLTLPLTDKKKKIGRVYTDLELSALWDAMGEDLRDQFVLAFECFMRLREALHLTWERLDLETGKLILRPEDVKTGSKTGKGRVFFVSPNALERLRRRKLRQRISTPYIFPSPLTPSEPRGQNNGAWAKTKKRAKIVGRARWHDIRHTSLTKALLEQSLNPLQVSEYSGVSMRTIQRVYLHSNEEHTRGVSGALSISRINNETEGVKKA